MAKSFALINFAQIISECVCLSMERNRQWFMAFFCKSKYQQKRRTPSIWGLVLLLGLSVVPEFSKAAVELRLLADGVLVYSGPSRKFRPVMRAAKGRKFIASSNLVKGDGIEFYKVVIVNEKTGRKRVGYLDSKEPLQVIGEAKDSEEELLKIKTLSQADSSIQLSTWAMKDSLYFWSAGYQKYFSPELYLKLYLGQLFNKTSGSLAAGAEVGLDQELIDQFSLFTAFSLGVIGVGTEDVLFQNSATLNYSVIGTGGLKYSADEFASVSVGIGQASVFNENNSYVSAIVGFTVEVGL
jgi:hypothetical protein